MTNTRTCTRCNGTGMLNTPVVHLGVPGLCFGCDGQKVQVLVPAATLQAVRKANIRRRRAELEERARVTEDLHRKRLERRRRRADVDTCRAARGLPPITDKQWDEETALYSRIDARYAADVEFLEDAWRHATDIEIPTRDKWLGPLQATDIHHQLQNTRKIV